jgi:hypothetical protein
VLTAFSAPLDDNHDQDRDRDHGRDHGRDWDHGWDGRRDRDGRWDGHPWRWWHDWGISVALRGDGGGHVDWNRHRCESGRFDDFHVR